MQVKSQEQIGKALKRFKRLLEDNRKFEKWHRKGKWQGVYIKPSIIRGKKKLLKRVKAREQTVQAKRAGEQ